MLPIILLPPDQTLEVETVTGDTDCLVVQAASYAPTAICPVCQQHSRRVHSRYQRRIADLPASTTPVSLCVQARRFFCTNRQCRRQIFCERLPHLANAYGRRTQRLCAAIGVIGLALGGRAGARLARQLAVTCSRQTVLRLVSALPVPPVGSVRIVGIDDFAFTRGRRYGTLVCDHERGCVVDLLPERSAGAVAAWFAAHPEVEVITRDRAAVYREGASRGAPQALQVVDRFHLAKNLGEAVEGDLTPLLSVLQEVADRGAVAAIPPPIPPPTPEAAGTEIRATPEEAHGAARLIPAAAVHTGAVSATKQALHTAVHTLHAQGCSQQAIACQLHINRRTVRRYLAFEQRLPPRLGSCLYEPYLPYLLQRWNEGFHNGTQLWREIRAQGYPGARSTLVPLFARLRGALGIPPRQRRTTSPSRTPAITAPPVRLRGLVFVFLADPATLEPDQQQYLAALCAAHAGVAAEYRLTQAFMTLVRQRQGTALPDWVTAATADGLPHLRAFAAGLQQDWAAVQAGLTLPWSNGRSEGLVNKLKMIKRSMFGRAGFTLLRRRVLAA